MKFPKPMTLKQLKNQVYNCYQVKDSKQLKKVSILAAKLDLRYKKNWQVLVKDINSSMNNVISLASHIVRKGDALDAIETGLKSLSEDLVVFENKIEADFADKRKKSQKYRESLIYL